MKGSPNKNKKKSPCVSTYTLGETQSITPKAIAYNPEENLDVSFKSLMPSVPVWMIYGLIAFVVLVAVM